MLSGAVPFPLPGSYALIEHEGETRLARIVQRRGGDALIALPERADAGGNLNVAVADLMDGTPETPAETAEFNRLWTKRKTKAERARLDHLRNRRIWTRILAEKLAAHEARRRRRRRAA